MIDASRLTKAESVVLRDALVVYAHSLDRRINLAKVRAVDDDLTWRRYLTDEILDTLRAG